MKSITTLVSDPAARRLSDAAGKLCGHPEFGASERLKTILCYLCDRADRDPDRRITQAEIATEVMNLGASFDPSADAHVRIEIGRLRRELALFYARNPEARVARLEIPKGGYRPVLRPGAQAVHVIRGPESEDRPIIAIADLGGFGGERAEAAGFITAEARLRCQNAPLVRSGALGIASIATGSETDCSDAARDIGASLVLCGRIYPKDDGDRIHLALLDTATGVTAWRAARSVSVNTLSTSRGTHAVADEIANAVVDPIAGVAPAWLASANPTSVLSALFSAYDYMASQDADRVRRAIDGLMALESTGRGSATSLSLLADMLRVGTNMRLLEAPIQPERCLDLTERALRIDPEDHTARLARGYALLNMGEPTDPTNFGDETLRSLSADADLLDALSGRSARQNPAGDIEERDCGHRLFMEEFPTVVRMIKAGRFAVAQSMLETSTNTDIFWLHLFRTAVHCHLGDLDAARTSACQLKSLAPRMGSVADTVIGGFFPDPDLRDLFREGLGRAMST